MHAVIVFSNSWNSVMLNFSALPSDRVTRFCYAKAHSGTRNMWILWIPKIGNIVLF